MKRLVLFVEGEGDVAAAPALISRILNYLPLPLQGHLFLDSPPYRVGGIDRFTGKSAGKLHDHIRLKRDTTSRPTSETRRNPGAPGR
jgi:hypothetical protein